MRRPAVIVFAALAALGPAVTADAHDQGPAVARAIEGLRAGPVTYEPDSGLTELEADTLYRRLKETHGVYMALLAPASLQSSPAATAADLGRHLGEDGTYVVSAGAQLGAWSSAIDRSRLDELLATARTTQPRAIALQELGTAIASEPSSDGDGLWRTAGAVAAGAVLAALALVALRQRRGAGSPPASSRP